MAKPTPSTSKRKRPLRTTVTTLALLLFLFFIGTHRWLYTFILIGAAAIRYVFPPVAIIISSYLGNKRRARSQSDTVKPDEH